MEPQVFARAEQPTLLRCSAVCVLESEGELYHLLSSWLAFSHFLCYSQASWALPGGWFCEPSKTWCVSPMNSLVRLGVCPEASTPVGFFIQRFWGFIFPQWNTGRHGLSCSPIVPPRFIRMQVWDQPLYQPLTCCESTLPNCPSPPLLQVWLNVSSLTPWFPDFHTVQFSLSSGGFFVCFLLSILWMCEEAQCIYLGPHLGRKSIRHFFYTIGLFFLSHNLSMSLLLASTSGNFLFISFKFLNY